MSNHSIELCPVPFDPLDLPVDSFQRPGVELPQLLIRQPIEEVFYLLLYFFGHRSKLNVRVVRKMNANGCFGRRFRRLLAIWKIRYRSFSDTYHLHFFNTLANGIYR